MLKRFIRSAGAARKAVLPAFSRPTSILSSSLRVLPLSTNRLPFITRSFTSSFPKFAEEKKATSNMNQADTIESPTEEKITFEKVTKSQMRDESLDKIKSDGRYQLGFARKEIVSILPFFTHSAAAFLDLNATGEAKWLIFGRQTPFFLKGSHFFGGLNKLYHSVTDSAIDNEKNYDFFPSHDFVVEKSNVTLTGKEVKEILQNADKEVCASHNGDYNLIQSNCYSASVDVLAFAIDAIAKRTENTAEEHAENNRCIDFIRERLLAHATQDNLHLWVGILTEPRVRAHLKAVDLLIAERHANNKFNPSSQKETRADECRPEKEHTSKSGRTM